MLPVKVGLQLHEAMQDRVITTAESTQLMTTVFNGMVGVMVITFGMIMFNKALGSSRTKPPKPVARVVTVPGGSHWRCAKCGKELRPGEEAVKIGAKTYCVECARGGNPEGMEEWKRWEAMMASIRKAAKILNIELTEQDTPEYLNWSVGRAMHEDLWARVYAREKSGNPTTVVGACYSDAWRFLIKQEEGHLIHGSAQFSAEGPRVNHAWVELPSGHVFEPQTGQYFTTEDFKVTSPIEDHRYSVEEAAIMAARTGNLGPWGDEERAKWL